MVDIDAVQEVTLVPDPIHHPEKKTKMVMLKLRNREKEVELDPDPDR